ncbi:hypothetical protein LCGC14_0991690 [marine sediment metagenome]|uniref:Uncharacterized protein n=1 Tax=marine sediment metagenome TaxID=412755 RepID=A0A0F9N5N0_9ZZZZ
MLKVNKVQKTILIIAATLLFSVHFFITDSTAFPYSFLLSSLVVVIFLFVAFSSQPPKKGK